MFMDHLSKLTGLMALEGISTGYNRPSCRETFSETSQESKNNDIAKAAAKRARKEARNKAFRPSTLEKNNG